jgi:asparagine synthase (glutamine-hydrolysing)
MCGIAGVARAASLRSEDRAFAAEAARLLAHRGPDDEGVWTGSCAALGHRRLAVIDLDGGSQPMSDPTGRYHLVYNGELYNHRDLAADLETRGWTWRTRSDSEVLLGAYAEWGPACLARLDGIFAFAIWDDRERSLLLARDHFGVKPLLYWSDSDSILFASELKVLARHPRMPVAIDPLALSDYLSCGYVLTPRSILKDVKRLEPATYVLWRDGSLQRHRYWDLADHVAPRGGAPPSFDEASEAIRAEVTRAVCAQKISDVPLGAFLSGGLDSTTVVQALGTCTTGDLHTFSLGFPDASYSELPFAREAAAALGTHHVDEVIDPDLTQLLPRLVRDFDEPFADTSAVPTWWLARLARRHVTVALSGDGGDEVFGGYETYLANRFARAYARLPGGVRRAAIPLVNAIPASGRKVSWDYKLKQFVRFASEPPARAHYGWRLLFDEHEKRALWGPDVTREVGDYTPEDVFRSHFARVSHAPPLHQALYVDMQTWLLDGMLNKVDRASMAHGLEVRVPLLDRRLVEHSLSLPPEYKIRGLSTKRVLRRAMQGRIPQAVLTRRKRGFNSPVSRWAPALPESMWQPDAACLPGFEPVRQRLLAEHRSRQADNGFKLWTLLNWGLWRRHALAPEPVSA